MRGKRFFACVLAAASLASAQAVIFSEDFESLVDGELNGQGGWTTTNGLPLGSTSYLGSRVLAGILAGGSSDLHYASHALSLVGETGQITLSFDAYGLAAVDADALYSHNSGAGFGFNGTSMAAGWRSHGGFKWVFDASALTGNAGDTFNAIGGHGSFSQFEVVIDRDAGTVFGRYNMTLGGSGETAHFAIGNTANIDLLISLTSQQDLSDQSVRTGVDLDNFRVVAASPTSVPEPFTMALGAMGAVAGYRRMKRRAARTV